MEVDADKFLSCLKAGVSFVARKIMNTELKSELAAYKLLLDSAHMILLNANDFFGWACADAVELDVTDLSWVIPIVKKYGDDGVSACMHYVRQQLPLQKYLTEEEHKAYKELEELKPKVYSESEK